MKALILAAPWAAFSLPALAQSQAPCAERTEFLEHLRANYSESPVAMGLAVNGGLLEIVASPGGSWTIIVTMPNGISCAVASGMNWQNIDEPGNQEPAA